MIARRELDALVAEKVFGVKEFRCVEKWDRNSGAHDINFPDLPNYSTDVSAAWSVIPKLWHLGYEVVTVSVDAVQMSSAWRCSLESYGRKPALHANGWDAPDAICRAAIKAVGVDLP